ncbi:MAG TPA: HAF repeat-containing protein [Thermoanaerobaculia bacterium]|jgi:probable HAF family extracellular repeat protein
MKTRHARALAFLSLVLPLLLPLSMAAQQPRFDGRVPHYTVVDLGSLGGGYSEAWAINASGQIVGDSATAGGSSHAFLYGGGAMTDLNLPGTSATARSINASGQVGGYYYEDSYQGYVLTGGTVADVGNLGALYSATYAINATGQACGSSMTSSGDEHAFFYSTGVIHDINPLGGDYSTARGINSAGRVVGYAYLPNGAFHAYVRTSAGVVTDLGTLGGDYSAAYAINDSGRIVGQAYLPGNVSAHAFLWNGSTLKDLGLLPGGNYSEAHAVNSTATQIVGSATVPDPEFLVYHAFVYVGGRMRDLNALIPHGSGWVLSEANGINDAGQIVGSGTRNGQTRAFLLNPQ